MAGYSSRSLEKAKVSKDIRDRLKDYMVNYQIVISGNEKNP
jgi:hypothetical protein